MEDNKTDIREDIKKDINAEAKIGNVTLNYSHYSGEDLYCDGAVEDEILDIVKNMSKVEYRSVIEERKSWPILYHLSAQRENIVDWIPLDGKKVLEVGSGCGAITGSLAARAETVTCVDLSKKRSMINAYRHSECTNVTIHVGNFKDIEPDLDTDYDYICLIGVFEYAKGYIGGDTPYEDFLRILGRHLSADGRMIIAIENKYGLKYFAGCKEDHLGSYFDGIENYVDGGGVRTFGRRGLEKIFKNAGVEEYHFYYPYPDYKFMNTLYSDAYRPAKGELTDNLRNFDRDRMLLFDEKNAFDGILDEELFPVFSNSFLAVIGAGYDLKYVKYSNDRTPEYAIRTQIMQTEDGGKTVRKYPTDSAGCEHIRQMYEAFGQLSKRYEGGRLCINKCELHDADTFQEMYAEFEFVEGTPLSELLDECLERGDIDGFHALFKEYLERVGYNSEYPVADFDLIFSNILVNGDDWTLIDYEWTFGRVIETKELAFRAVYCYLLENEKRDRLDTDRIMEELAITEQDAENYREQERDFQKFVTGKHMSMSQIRDLIGCKVSVPQKWIDRYDDMEKLNRVQIYEDRGDGYSEENSYFLPDAYQGESIISLEISVSADVRALRIDPAFYSCIVKLGEMTFGGIKVPLEKRKILTGNGRIIRAAKDSDKDSPDIVFSTDDPNICINLEKVKKALGNTLKIAAENTFTAQMEIVRIPGEMAHDIEYSVKRHI
jgi:2-polyprenyl-3-methyl-5-hydroxy-6-metoxy-1,4-benzoquinol methylase